MVPCLTERHFLRRSCTLANFEAKEQGRLVKRRSVRERHYALMFLVCFYTTDPPKTLEVF